MIFSTGMEGGSFVMCEDLCGPPATSFDGVEGVLVGATVPVGGGGNGRFCCAPRVTANEPLASSSSDPAQKALLADLTSSKESPSISSGLLAFHFIIIHPMIRCIGLYFRGFKTVAQIRITNKRYGMDSPLTAISDKRVLHLQMS